MAPAGLVGFCTVGCCSALARAGITRDVRDCEGAYRDASDKVRRQFNQAFFKRILIDDSYSAIAELAEPFDLLLSREVRDAATRRSEAHLAAAVDDAMTDFDFDEGSGTGLEFAGVGAYSETSAGWGLKKETMVGARGLEPPTSAV